MFRARAQVNGARPRWCGGQGPLRCGFTPDHTSAEEAMTVTADILILHQYEISPFSEKVRVAMAIKGLSWRACNQPSIMPKPQLVALTGGYRRIPVLQIGADLYFDSQYIIEE